MAKSNKLSRKGVAVFEVTAKQGWEIGLGADMNVQIGLISISADVFFIEYSHSGYIPGVGLARFIYEFHNPVSNSLVDMSYNY